MSSHINIKSILFTQVKIEILHNIIIKLFKKTIDVLDSSDLEIIEKGILVKQILKHIFICHLNSSGEVITTVKITIDWQKYKIVVQLDESLEFKINADKSIKEQMSEASSLLTNYIAEICPTDNKVKVMYTYTQEVWKDKQQLKELQQFLNLKPVENLPEQTNKFTSFEELSE